MSNFQVAVLAVLPLFLMLLVGAYVRRRKMLTEKELVRVNGFVFNTLFPFLMFRNIYESDVSSSLDGGLIAFAVGGVLVECALATLVVCLLEKRNRSRGAMIQALFRSNYVLLGLPLVQNICGDAAQGAAAVVSAAVVPLYNVLAVVVLETFRGGKVRLGRIVLQVLKNPMILGALAGILSLALKIEYPAVLLDVVNDLAGAATPVALIILGATFNLDALKKSGRNTVICTVGRLVVLPALVLTAAVLAGFRGAPLAILLVVFATPSAVASFTMAQQMDSDGDLSASCVVLTSGLSVVTLFLWILLFSHLGLL